MKLFYYHRILYFHITYPNICGNIYIYIYIYMQIRELYVEKECEIKLNQKR